MVKNSNKAIKENKASKVSSDKASKAKQTNSETSNDASTEKNKVTPLTNQLYSTLKDKLEDKKLQVVVDNKNNVIKLQHPDNFMPSVYTKLNCHKDNHIEMYSDLPLVPIVQELAEHGQYVDDVKAQQVAKLIKKSVPAKVSYPNIDQRWVEFPRPIHIVSTAGLDFKESSDAKADNMEDVIHSVEKFTDSIIKILKAIKNNGNKYLVVRGIRPLAIGEISK